MLTEDQLRFKQLVEYIHQRDKWIEENNPFIKGDFLPSKRFTRISNENRIVLKTGFLKSETIKNDKELGQSWIYPNYAFIAKIMPDRGTHKTWGRLRTSVDFNQRRAGTLIKSFASEKELRKFQNDLENIFVCVMAYQGFKNLSLKRDGEGQLVLAQSQTESSQDNSLSNAFQNAVLLETYSRFQGNNKVPFGEITRTILPDFMRRIGLHYYIDAADKYSTVFALPMLDIGKMGFRVKEDENNRRKPHLSEHIRIPASSKNISAGASELVTADYMDNKILRFLNDAMAELGIHDRKFIDSFMENINRLRDMRRHLPRFTAGNLSSAHMDVIPRLQ